MKRLLTLMLLASLLTACGAQVNMASPQSAPSPVSSPTEIRAAKASSATSNVDDFFEKYDIFLSAPACISGLTPADQEGPYYKAGSPERNSLLEESVKGQKLILAGFVLDQNCQAIAKAWLDFWQANANGVYDNSGYTLRGHQFTDEQGRYYLETIMPGLYASRPIEHIHVTLQIPGGAIFTTQLYFPTQPVQNQTVTLEDHGEYSVGIFNFVLQK